MSLIAPNFSLPRLAASLTLLASALAQAVPAPQAAPEPAKAAAAPAAPKAPPDYNAISDKNLFDPQRKPWEEKREAPPALPALMPEDVQIYGIMAVGSFKQAIVKVGGKLKHLAPTDPKARPYIQLKEGQSLGGYTLTEINPQRLIFSVGETRYQVAINKKEDRPTAPTVPLAPVFQDAVVIAAEAPNGSDGKPMAVENPIPTPAPTPAAPAATPAAPEQTPQNNPNSGANNPQQTADNSANNNANPGRPLSLLEAINQAKNSGAGSSPMVNPFAPR